jgi:ribose 5-phosphate isomerase B
MNPGGSKRKKLWIASDHAGFELKEKLKTAISVLEIGGSLLQVEWMDVGTHSRDSTDYPIWSVKLCQEVLKNHSDEDLRGPCGVLICGSGVGVSIQANRFPKIRAVLALREDIAQFSRLHNATNVLCLGGRFLSLEEATAILERWSKTQFEGGRHEGRVSQLDETRRS